MYCSRSLIARVFCIQTKRCAGHLRLSFFLVCTHGAQPRLSGKCVSTLWTKLKISVNLVQGATEATWHLGGLGHDLHLWTSRYFNSKQRSDKNPTHTQQHEIIFNWVTLTAVSTGNYFHYKCWLLGWPTTIRNTYDHVRDACSLITYFCKVQSLFFPSSSVGWLVNP